MWCEMSVLMKNTVAVKRGDGFMKTKFLIQVKAAE